MGSSSQEVVYHHLVHIESHWTTQIQNQQQRNGSIMTVIGVILGFSGFSGAAEFDGQWGEPAATFFGIGLAALAVALLFGLASMWPAVGIKEHDWMKPDETLKLGTRDSAYTYGHLASSLAGAIGDTHHRRTLIRRRAFMLVEIALTIGGLVALGISIWELLAPPA